MKRFIIFFIAGVLISSAALAQGWEPQTSPTANTLYAVVFVDSSRGWAVGDSGIIVHTTNGGGVWAAQNSGATDYLSGVSFVDVNNGWAVGDSGMIVHTTDGGNTWTTQSSGTGWPLSAVDFVDINSGWIVGGQMFDYPGGGVGVILHTSDGGNTWTPEVPPESIWVQALAGVAFTDARNGCVVGVCCSYFGMAAPGIILRTTDGGETWSVQIIGPPSADLDFVDADNGWAVGTAIFHTTDGGNTWTAQDSGADYSLNGLSFVDTNYGWAVGFDWDGNNDPAFVVHTINGGETWMQQATGAMFPLNDVDFVDLSHGWAVGEGGTILRYNPTLQAPDEDFIPHPSSLSLSSYPNPFNPSTTIAYDLPKAGHISLRVFDLLGREVALLEDGMMEAGTHRLTFDGSGLPSGIYFARLDAAGFSQTKKLMLLK